MVGDTLQEYKETHNHLQFAANPFHMSKETARMSWA